jgi:hypothetical protein
MFAMVTEICNDDRRHRPPGSGRTRLNEFLRGVVIRDWEAAIPISYQPRLDHGLWSVGDVRKRRVAKILRSLAQKCEFVRRPEVFSHEWPMRPVRRSKNAVLEIERRLAFDVARMPGYVAIFAVRVAPSDGRVVPLLPNYERVARLPARQMNPSA